MSQWHYQVMGEQRGPVSSSEIRALVEQGTIVPDTLVRRATEDRWFNADRIRGLFAETGEPIPQDPHLNGSSSPARREDSESTQGIVADPPGREDNSNSPGETADPDLAVVHEADSDSMQAWLISGIALGMIATAVSLIVWYVRYDRKSQITAEIFYEIKLDALEQSVRSRLGTPSKKDGDNTHIYEGHNSQLRVIYGGDRVRRVEYEDSDSRLLYEQIRGGTRLVVSRTVDGETRSKETIHRRVD